jgi:hypothetical protein
MYSVHAYLTRVLEAGQVGVANTDHTLRRLLQNLGASIHQILQQHYHYCISVFVQVHTSLHVSPESCF